jgi:hypothetical protein
MTYIHWILIAANTIIIVGGTQTNTSDSNTEAYKSKLKNSVIYWAVGQACFLLVNVFFGYFLTRGMFGLLQSQIRNINYADVAAYQGDGKDGIRFTKAFVGLEACFAILMEWSACCLLSGIMFTGTEIGKLDEAGMERIRDRGSKEGRPRGDA